MKLQPVTSKIIPSFTPSRASQTSRSLAMIARAIAVGECSSGNGSAVGPFRRNPVQVHRDTACRKIRMTGSHRRSTGNDSVEVERIALRHEHGFASACRATDEVGMRRRPAVVTLDDLSRQHGDAAVSDVLEVESGLLILHEGAIERAAGTLVAGIGRRNSEASSQCRLISGGLSSGGLSNGAVQAAAALLQSIVLSSFREARWRSGCHRSCRRSLCVDPSSRRCGNARATPVRPVRRALPAHVLPAQFQRDVISRVTPGLRNFAMSEHFEFDCAKAVTCIPSRTIGTMDSFMSFSKTKVITF